MSCAIPCSSKLRPPTFLKSSAGRLSDLQTVLNTLVEISGPALRCGHGFRDASEGLRWPSLSRRQHGVSPEWFEYMQINPLEPDRGTLIGRILLERRIIHIPDVLADPEYTSAKAQQLGGFRAVLGIPMLREGTAIGVFMIARRTPQPFTDKQIELVTTFADQAVIAIENVRLFEEVQARTRELQESLEYQTATSDVLNVISRSPSNLQPVLDTILTTAVRLCNAEHATAFRLESAQLLLMASNSPESAFVDHVAAHPMAVDETSTAGRAILQRRAIHVPDVSADRTLTSPMVRLAKINSILAVPLLRDSTPIGVITLGRSRVMPFTDRQIDLITTFADQAVIALNNVGLFEEVQARTDELTEALRQQTATADVLKVISRSTFDLQAVLDTLTQSAAQLCEAEMAGIVRPRGDAYYWATSHGFPPAYSEYVAHYAFTPGRATVVGRVLLEGSIAHIPDVLADAEYGFKEGQKLGGYRAVLGVPLLREGSPIGVLLLLRPQALPFSTKEIELAATFADQAVIAIENVRLFETVQARTRELSDALEQQTATSEVLQVINASPGDLAPVFEAMLAKATQLCNAKLGIMWSYDGEAFTIAAERGTPPPSTVFGDTLARPGPTTALGRVQREKRVLHIPDMMDEEAYRAGDPMRIASVDALGMRSWLGVPLLKEGKLLGSSPSTAARCGRSRTRRSRCWRASPSRR